MTSGIDLEARLTAYLELRRALGMKMDRDARVLEGFCPVQSGPRRHGLDHVEDGF